MSETFTAEAAAGSIRTEPGDRAGLHFERLYDATPAELWAALTEPSSLRGWFAEVAGLELRPGSSFEMRFPTADGHVATGRVRAAEPERLLEWEWLENGDRSVVRFELVPRPPGCLLVLDHRLLDRDEVAGHGAGWQGHLDALAALVGGGGAVDPQARYVALRPSWEAQRTTLERGFGVIRPDGDTSALVFERRLDAPRERVWQALTEPAELARWLTHTTIEPHVGGRVVIDWGEDGQTTGTVLAWEPPALLELSWIWEGVLDAVLRLELLDDGGATLLRLEHRRIRPDLAWDLGSGWHAFLDGLGDVVDRREVGSWSEREQAVRAYYAGEAAALA
jgi:uncharacterized protein YndB with AHSA1/START domain